MHLQSYIQQTRDANECLSIRKENKNNKGKISIHIKSRFRRVDTAAKQAMQLCFQGTKMSRRKTDF